MIDGAWMNDPVKTRCGSRWRVAQDKHFAGVASDNVIHDEERRRLGSLRTDIRKRLAAGMRRGKVASPRQHAVATWCAAHGHAYGAFDTGWRCATCGNHVPRRDGERYGLAMDGRTERRRQGR